MIQAKVPNQISIDDWLKLYKSITDPDERVKRKREFERKQRVEVKKQDTGA